MEDKEGFVRALSAGESEIGRLREKEREAFRAFEEAGWMECTMRLHEWLDAGRALREAEGRR